MSTFVRVIGSADITSTTGSVTVGTAMTAGDSIVVTTKGGATVGATVTSVTDSKGNAYVQENSLYGNVGVSLWTCKNPATPLGVGDTITTHWSLSQSGFGSCMTALEYGKLSTKDKTGSHGDGSGSATSASVTASGATTSANECAIAVIATSNQTATSSTSSFVKRSDGPGGELYVHTYDQDLTSTGTPSCTASFGGNIALYDAIMVTFPVPFHASKTQTAKARVQKTLTKAQTAVARVRATVTKAQTAKARVQNTAVTKAQTAKARVQITGTKAQTAIARISRPEIDLPFIASKTRVFDLFSLFDPNKTYAGPGNGGETFSVRLNANGVTTTATLASAVGLSGTPSLTMTGDAGMPPTGHPFVATIDSEQLLLVPMGGGGYLVRQRPMGNTTLATHSPGATVSWNDTYDMPVVSTVNINTDFTANIEGTGSSLYTGWLMAFDSTQAYKSDGSRFPLHASELVGVFAAGAGTSGPSKTDGPQPSAVHAPEASSDHCGAALTVPALITTDIVPGDVLIVRYTNPESFVLDLGPRAGAIQSWFGLKRVDTTDHDVTTTNPNGIVVDTKSGYGTYTGSVNVEPNEPLPSAIGIAKDTSDTAGSPIPTPNPVPWLNTTLLGADRYFTDGVHYSERGWPVGVLSVRQGNRRVPFWQSWEWHDFNYVYSGFGVDDSFAQVVINRNGMTGVLPTISLPGAQDIDGPEAYWDDGTYYFGASWYVLLVATPYLVAGPVVGGVTSPPGTFIPVATFPTSGSPPVITGPSPPVEGGSGGDIAPSSTGLHGWSIF